MQALQTAGARPGWTLIVPVKPLAQAKTRLSVTTGDALRPELALAFAQDTVAAALRCPRVRDVVVVTDDPLVTGKLATLGARVVPDAPPAPGPDTAGGLNAALTRGAAAVRATRPDAPLATLNADLPALRPEELLRVLNAAGEHPRAFLADADGKGTTLLSVLPGVPLAPDFGGASRARHTASGAVEIALSEVDSVRRDVDTGADLAVALLLGVGPHTARYATVRDGRPVLVDRGAPGDRGRAADRGVSGRPTAGSPVVGPRSGRAVENVGEYRIGDQPAVRDRCAEPPRAAAPELPAP